MKTGMTVPDVNIATSANKFQQEFLWDLLLDEKATECELLKIDVTLLKGEVDHWKKMYEIVSSAFYSRGI